MRNAVDNVLRRLPVKHRLILVITLILIPALIVTLSLQQALYASGRALETTIQTAIEDLLPVARLEFHIEQAKYELQRLRANPKAAGDAPLVARINDDFIHLRKQDDISNLVSRPIDTAYEYWELVAPLMNKVQAATQVSTMSASALGNSDHELAEAIDQLQRVHSQLLSVINSRYHKERTSENRYEAILLFAWLAGIAAVGTSIYFLSLSIVVPLLELKMAAAAVQAGDYDARVALHGNDEFSAVGRSFNVMAEAMGQAHRQLYDGAMRDPLTGLLNRRALDLALQQGCAAWKPLSLIILDVDHFKSINDTFGHEAGDEALIGLSQQMVKVVRPGDSLGRYGGDEFLIVLPGLAGDVAAAIAQRLVDHLEWCNKGRPFNICISVGVAEKGTQPVAASAMFDAADKALYQAKAAGRGTIRTASAA